MYFLDQCITVTCSLQEVFKSDYCASSNLKHVLGKCYVMFVKDYFKQKPEVRQYLAIVIIFVLMLINAVISSTFAVTTCFNNGALQTILIVCKRK